MQKQGKENFWKLLVLMPVLILAFFYFRARYREEFLVAGLRGKASLAVGVLLMLFVMFIGVVKKRQKTPLQILLQSSFLVYVFMVLTLTGYFILFSEVAAHGWWHRVVQRMANGKNINLHPFRMFKQFRIISVQVLGNFVMLMPLAVYIPLIFRKCQGFFEVTMLCLLVSVSIELMQLITFVRSTDIDDVILNTSGSVVAFLLYRIARFAFVKNNPGHVIN